MKNYLLVIAAVEIISLIGTTQYYRNKDKVNFEKIEALKDCRFELEIYIRRERGERFPKTSYDICDLDPLDKICSCAMTRKE